MPLGPVNVKAFDTGVLTPQELLNVNTYSVNYPKQLLVDPNFYIGQLDKLTERFDTLVQK
jgi:putative spermidine/putrescine transport system substrate-binding protein